MKLRRFFQKRRPTHHQKPRKPILGRLSRGLRPKILLRREPPALYRLRQRGKKDTVPPRALAIRMRARVQSRPHEEYAAYELRHDDPASSVTFAEIRDALFHEAAPKSVCQSRAERQAVLFAKKIAGRPGKSPGKGGTYRRTDTSHITCERTL